MVSAVDFFCGTYFFIQNNRKNTVFLIVKIPMLYYKKNSEICKTNHKNLTMNTEFNANGEKQAFSASSTTLPTDFIQNLVDNYRNNQLSFINENLGKEDAHSIWFDLPSLKKFIAEIEHEAQRVDPSATDKDLGIRLYYGAYPDSPAAPTPEDYAKRHTLVMIPTKKMDDGSGALLDFDFNPFDSASKVNSLAATASISKNSLGQNHGSLIPPNNSIVESF